jgi:uncharacterized membrane protein YedE/YeeE
MTTTLLRLIASLAAGILFGLGLSVSGLTNPDKVQQFLTLSENWSPALLFTMGAAIIVTYAGFRLVMHRGPIFEEDLHLPVSTQIDRRLMIGAGIFGAGWGLAGFCPGPAVTGLGSGMLEPFIFVIAMIIGGQLQRTFAK